MGEMKVLWIVNVAFPEICHVLGLEKTVIGGWLYAYRQALKDSFNNIKLYIISPYNGSEIRRVESNGDVFYVFPDSLGKNSLFEFYKDLNDKIQPDVVHIHGTEFFHSFAFLEVNGNKNVLVSIQGLVSVYSKYFYGNISKMSLMKFVSLRDILKGDTLWKKKSIFVKNGKTERELIRRANFIAGRTSWDYSNCWEFNRNMTYFKLNEALRPSFYENQWNINRCNRHTIFMSQTYYPIKGLHKMLEALPLVLSEYPDTELFLCGEDITQKPWYKITTYGKYIKYLIKKNKLEGCVHFLGIMSEKQMVEHYLSANVFVSPSSIENSSNSVCEAQLIGTPVISSYVGGIMDLVEDEKSGLLYRFEETCMLANKICRVFKNDELAQKLSHNARSVALVRHDRKAISDKLIDIYNYIRKI